ncbi:MAG: DUF3224 domain-containing protein [Gemmatimonadales bacterium]|nr:DUF3224 domain-containing protein [Gemmatimonadales bacterium]
MRPALRSLVLACLGLLAGAGAGLPGQTPMTHHATGTFDVKVSPQSLAAADRETGMGRMLLEKQYHGDLEAGATGEMLTGMGTVPGSAGYVAIERVEGTLQGRRGSFLLQHIGTMTRNTPSLSVQVIPDSGTDGLTGIAGTLTIRILEGRHEYDLDYTLPAAQN